MKELIIPIIKIVAPISVALIVFAQGLSTAPSLVVSYFKDRPGLLLRSLFATLVLVPAAALAIILLLEPATGTGIGLAILVACPPAPLMLRAAAQKGGASQAFMAALHLGLAVLAFVTVPLVLDVLSIPLGFHADVNLGATAWILGRTILVPLGLGLAARALSTRLAETLGPVLGKVGMIGVGLVVLVVLMALYPALLKMDPWSYLVIVTVSVVAIGIGHLVGPKDASEKTTLAVECGVRHPMLALTIAAANFTPQKALPVLVPCVITSAVVATIYLVLRGRRQRSGKTEVR